MNRHFAIGCMRGGACAFVVGGWVSLCLQIYTGRLVFLWLNIFLLVCVGLISWMGHKLKVEETMPNDKQADRELNAVQVTYGANGVEANCACGWHFHSDSAGAVQWQAAHHTPCSRLQQAAPTPQAQEFAQNQVDLAIDPSSALPIPADFTALKTELPRYDAIFLGQNIPRGAYLAEDVERTVAQLQQEVAKLTMRNERLTKVHDLALTSALQEDPRYFKERVLQEWEKDTHRMDDLQRTIAQLREFWDCAMSQSVGLSYNYETKVVTNERAEQAERQLAQQRMEITQLHMQLAEEQENAEGRSAQEFAQNQVDLAIDPSSALPIPADFTAQETQGERRYPCPVCDFEMHGPASGYNICPQCGTEFENDDETTSHSELRQRWIDGGRRFWWYEKQHERMNKPQAALKAEKGGNDVTYFNQS